MVLLLSGLTAAVAIPLLFSASYRFMQPHLAMQHLIQHQSTPFVVIDDMQAPSIAGQRADDASDHVRNLPDLSNRPLRFSAEHLTPALLTELCRRGPVTLITRADMHRVGLAANIPERSPKFEALVAAVAQEAPGCFRADMNPP
ncbi:MAG TPA: hypothetical protein VFW35_02740, partial [Sphingomicrobium sp.]|nr:hypothetical protein [Sphingomicrobium sp.]